MPKRAFESRMRPLLLCLLALVTGCSGTPTSGTQLSAARAFSVTRPQAVLHGKHLGSGPPLILVHGGADHRIFHPVLDRLASEFTVVFYDQRGYGATEVSEAAPSTTLATDVADLDAIRAHFGWQKVSVLAYSHGGPIGLEYARTSSARLSKLILLATYSDNETRIRLAQKPASAVVADESRRKQLRELDQLDLSEDERKVREFMITPHFFHERELARTDVEFWLASKCIDSGDKRWRSPRTKVFTELLREIATDTLVLCGELDRITPLQHSRRMAQLLPNARLGVLSGCGHLCHADDSESFIRAVREYLR